VPGVGVREPKTDINFGHGSLAAPGRPSLLAARGLFLALSLLIQINLDWQWLPKRRGPEIRPHAA
jgi:hypothetical protein